MNKPSNRVGDVESRSCPRCEPASQVARLRRKARPASLAIVIGSLLAMITLHTIWSNCSAESGVYFQLSDTVQPTGGRGEGRGLPAAPSGEPVAGAVIAASYLAERREPSRGSGAPIVTPDAYRPKYGRSSPTTDRSQTGGAAVAPRVAPSRLKRTQADDDRYVQPLPEVVIAPPESHRRATTHTTYPAPSRVPSSSVEFAHERRTTSQPEPRDSFSLPARANSAATSDETFAGPLSSIRLADRDRVEPNRVDRPTRWKIEARPPVSDASEENVAAGIVVREQISPPTDESAPSHSRISLRLRDAGADRAVSSVPRTSTPERDTRALPDEKQSPNDKAKGSTPLRESLPEIDGRVAARTVQRQPPTDDSPPRPSLDFVPQKTPGVPPVDDSLAKRFAKNTIGWKVVRQKDQNSKLAVADEDQPGQTRPEEPLDGDRPPTMNVAVKDSARTSGGGSRIAKPSATERWKLDQKPGPSRLALRYAIEEPEPPPGVPSRFLKDGGARDLASHDVTGTSGPRNLADVFALSRGEPVVPAARNISLSTAPVKNPVPFAFGDGEGPPTHRQTAVWRSPDGGSGTDVRGEERSTPSVAANESTRQAIVRLNADIAAAVESLPAKSNTLEGRQIPLAVAQAREDTASPAPDVDGNGGWAPASAPNTTPKLLVHGLAAKPISQVSVDIRPPVDDSPLGNEFPDEVCLPSDPTGETPPIDESFTRGWAYSSYSWAATGLSHRPLYFEQVNLERYGYAPTRSRTGQSILAGAHFFGSALILPYRMGAEPMNECVYTLGHYRPGSYVPYRIERPPLDWKGGALETVTLMGLIFAIP